MLYTAKNKHFKHHVHPALQRRLQIFMVISAIMLAAVVWDIIQGMLTIQLALLTVAVGGIVGWATTRIFHLSWSRDGAHVVGRIDKIGWFVLSFYIALELGRAWLFQAWVPESATALTYAFVASALLSRVLGLRGRIIRVLESEKVFG